MNLNTPEIERDGHGGAQGGGLSGARGGGDWRHTGNEGGAQNSNAPKGSDSDEEDHHQNEKPGSDEEAQTVRREMEKGRGRETCLHGIAVRDLLSPMREMESCTPKLHSLPRCAERETVTSPISV